LDNFYGIELDDFAHEIAILSLWLAEHQMNQVFFKAFGRALPALPLKETGNIFQGNATRLDWEVVCPKKEQDEIYILGNPPYLGARNQNEEQKEDMAIVFEGREEYKDSDYIACWLIKGAIFISGFNAKYGFVSTNSICQGEQVAHYWPTIFHEKLEISFAYQSFKWLNNAKSNAAVICVIVGVQNIGGGKKFIYNGTMKKEVSNITPYLTLGNTTFVNKSSTPITNMFPPMVMGNMARDGGNLILTFEEKNNLLNDNINSDVIIRKFNGSQEFIQGSERWCLWILDNQLELANSIPGIKKRIQNVFDFRVNSSAKTTNAYASIPHKFAQRCHKDTDSIIIPRVSSELRPYIPIGFLTSDTVISDSANAIYDAKPWIFAILTSRMHMAWVRAVGGRLKTDYRYSSSLCYNTFPFPPISDSQKAELKRHVFRILEERERHSEKTLAQLYDPDKMPEGLREAHHQNDLAVERCYRSKPFESDEERLEYLFKMYEQMIEQEKTKGTLFEVAGKTKKKKK
jgi:hypothetical protein